MSIDLKSIITSIVRTVSPFIVGAIVAWFARHNITFDTEFLANLSKVLDLLLGSLLYVAARFLETYISPKFGWLLFWAKQPVYLQAPQIVNPTLTANPGSGINLGTGTNEPATADPATPAPTPVGLEQAPPEDQPQSAPPEDGVL